MTKFNNDDNLIDELGSRIDALQKIPLKTSVIIAISLASFFTYYDITNYSYISPILKATWNIGDAEIAYGASMTILGYVIGAICITVFADTNGRKPAFILSILLLGSGSILAASSQDMTQMALFRLLTGIGIGAEIAIVSSYIGEMSPKSKRGKYTSIIILIGWAGLTSSGPISFLLIQQAQVIGIDSWRIVLAIAGTVALISLPFRIQMPESFRWLLAKGKIHQLDSVLMSLGIAPLEANNKTLYSSRKFSLRTFKNKPVMLRVLFSSRIVEGISRGLAALGPILFVLFQLSVFLNLMIVIASFSMIATIIITIYGSKTRGKSLEEISSEES